MPSCEPKDCPETPSELADSQQLSELIRQCLADEKAGPWEEMLAVARPLIESTFMRAGGARLASLDEFRDWFGAWLVVKGKLKRLAAAMDKSTNEQGVWPEKAVRSYFRRVVKSARQSFYRERRTFRALWYVDGEPADFVGGWTIIGAWVYVGHRFYGLDEEPQFQQKVQAVVEELPIEKRVLYKLRYCREMKPLSLGEVEWPPANRTRAATTTSPWKRPRRCWTPAPMPNGGCSLP